MWLIEKDELLTATASQIVGEYCYHVNSRIFTHADGTNYYKS